MLEYEGNNLAGLPDLHKHYVRTLRSRNIIPMASYKQSIWYNSVLQEELHEAPSGYKIQVFHWKLESGFRDVFRVKDFIFNSITMIIGPNTEYWYGMNTLGSPGLTKRGRHPRQIPVNFTVPNVRPSLPQCPRLLSSCNLTKTNACGCSTKSFLNGKSLTNRNNGELTLTKLNELDVIVERSDDDTDDDGVMQDILLFRIYMTKCSRDDALKAKKSQSIRCRFNFKNRKYITLQSIVESDECSE